MTRMSDHDLCGLYGEGQVLCDHLIAEGVLKERKEHLVTYFSKSLYSIMTYINSGTNTEK